MFRFTKWKFSGLRYVNRKLEILRFPFRKTELSRNSGLRNKFPDSISKMEIFFRKNGNPIYKLIELALSLEGVVLHDE